MTNFVIFFPNYEPKSLMVHYTTHFSEHWLPVVLYDLPCRFFIRTYCLYCICVLYICYIQYFSIISWQFGAIQGSFRVSWGVLRNPKVSWGILSSLETSGSLRVPQDTRKDPQIALKLSRNYWKILNVTNPKYTNTIETISPYRRVIKTVKLGKTS